MNNRIATLALVIVAGLGIFWLVQAGGDDQASEEPMVEVIVPSDLQQVAAGQRIFEENCATCHGKNASGLNGSGPPLIHKIYEPGHHSDMSFQLAVKNGVRAHHWKFGNMPPVEDVSVEEVNDIIAYVRTLQRANGIN